MPRRYSPLRRLRRDRELTQQELADAVGFARVTIAAVETGRLRPSPSFRQAIVDYFRVPEAEIFPGEDR